MAQDYTSNPLIIVGVIIFMIGVLIFCFGKKLVLLRVFFGDRSMFSQILWGAIIGLVGLVLLFLGGAFTN